MDAVNVPEGAASIRVPGKLLSVRMSWPLIIGAAVFVMLIQQPALLNDPDIYWHIRVGEWILANGTIPRIDYFSHTMFGAPWHAHEWLAELLFAAAYAKGGWAAVVMSVSAALAVALAVLCRYLLRFWEPIYALGATALAGCLLAPHLVARPHVLVMPLLIMWGIGLIEAHDERRLPNLKLLALVPLWANLHGSFIFAILLVPVFAAGAVIGAKGNRGQAMRWSAFLAACVGAAMLTPFGADGLAFAFKLNDMSFMLSQVGEWRSPDFQKPQPLELAMLVTAAAILARGLRLSWLRILLLLGLLHLALKHSRHADLLAVLGPVLLARPIGEQWFDQGVQQAGASLLDKWFHRLALPASPAAIGMIIAVLAAVSLMAVLSDALRPRAAFAPEKALHALHASTVTGRGLNQYEFGGFLIFSGVPTFIDGRVDLFGDRFLTTYINSLNLTGRGDSLTDLLTQHDIQWTLLAPGLPAVRLLDELPGWRRLYSDRIAVLHIRLP